MKLFDIETDGFLENLTEIYCAVVYDTDTGVFTRYNDQNNGQLSIDDLYAELSTGDLMAHYGIGFDYLAMRKLRPEWDPKGNLYDSVLISQVIWTNMKDLDFARCMKPSFKDFPRKLIGSHSLKAWGWRLGDFKDDFDPKDHGGTWDNIGWMQEMEDYCVQDVQVLKTLYEMIQKKDFSPMANELEHEFAHIIKRQELFGFKFDEEKANKLHGKLAMRLAEINDELRVWFKPWDRVIDPCFIPKVNNKTLGYIKGVPIVKIKTITFNPASRDHISERLMTLYGWEPKVFNEKDGKPKVDEEILKYLDYPCAPLLLEYQMVNKRLGMVAEGRQAWLKQVKEGRIYGRCNTAGAVTGRCTHNNPNVAQTPSSSAPYGAECRELFTVDKGYVLVGADASGLELRCLAHYMSPFDKGSYIQDVMVGDAHWRTLLAIGITKVSRDKQNKQHSDGRGAGKTWMYSYLYGCGEQASGEAFANCWEVFHGVKPAGTFEQLGRKSRKAVKVGLPALALLENAVKAKAKQDKMLKGLDGRILNVRSPHAALNMLLQSAGAIIMKQALVELEGLLQKAGLKNSFQSTSPDYEFVANIHDEFQTQVKIEHSELVARLSEESMVLAGNYFNFRCQIDGEAAIGQTWKDTH